VTVDKGLARRTGVLSKPKRVSLADSIADSIAEAIAARHLMPGERVIELNLAERLGVSRVPVREALKVLHAHGILSGANHRGYRVAEFGPETVAKVVEARLMIETFLLRDAIATWRAGKADPHALDNSIRQMEVAAKARDGLASLLADLAFHRTIRTAAHNDVSATLWDALARHVLIIFNQEAFRDNDLNAVVRQHKAFRDYIFDCVNAQEPPTVPDLQQAVEDHLLQVARKSPATKSAGRIAPKLRSVRTAREPVLPQPLRRTGT
jgi:DNA-binding GntR family transcriptional regulator